MLGEQRTNRTSRHWLCTKKKYPRRQLSM